MIQARYGNLDRQHFGTTHIIVMNGRRRSFKMMVLALGTAFDATNNPVCIGTFGATQLFDRLLHARLRMARQQLEHLHVLPDPRAGAVPGFQSLAQIIKRGWQFPVTIDIGMIQRRRSALKRIQIMQRIEDLIAPVVTSGMNRHDGLAKKNLDAIDISLHCHRLKCALARNAVTDVVESGKLILVDLGGLPNAGIEPMPG